MMDESMRYDTATPPEEFETHTLDVPEEAKLSFYEETIVKTEIIISPDDILPTVTCRLCRSADQLCSPIYNVRVGTELTEKYLETIYRMSDIIITYEKDHASVVCTHCWIKIEEYTLIREEWKEKNKAEHDSNVPAIQPAAHIICTEKITLENASTQTSDYTIVHKAPDVRDASTCTDNVEPAAPSTEHNIYATDDGDKKNGIEGESIDVEQYYNRMKRKRKCKKRQRKEELIDEVMQLVKRQFRSERNESIS